MKKDDFSRFDTSFPSFHDEQNQEHSTTSAVQRYKVTIGGESYFLVSDEPEERVKAVASFVDTQMRSMAQLGHNDDVKRLAVLVAIQCASKMVASADLLEYYQVRHEKILSTISEEIS